MEVLGRSTEIAMEELGRSAEMAWKGRREVR
jgi:hypothetical protein